MRKIRMLADISGTHDGVDWPKRGEVAEVSDAEATDMIAAKLAAPVGDKEAEAATKSTGPMTTGSGPVESAAIDTSPASRKR